MRRTLAISLLAVFLFQLVGYYFVYLGLSMQVNDDLVARLDAHEYSAEETITLKIPFTLPYWTDDSEFKRVDGDFEHEGQFYKLVKQKLSKDTLYVVCIRNHDKTKLADALNEYIKFSNDLPSASKQALKLWGSIVKDYLPNEQARLFKNEGWALAKEYGLDQVRSFVSPSATITSPPPEA